MEKTTPIFAIVETVTPAMAKLWLETSQGNRTLKKQRIDLEANEMREGRWLPTNQGIGFDINGHLIDGHHRLEAVIKAGVSVQMLVVRGLPPKAKEVIDLNVVRSYGDIYKLKTQAGNPERLVAAAKIVILLEEGGASPKNRHLGYPEIEAVIEREAAAFTWARQWFRNRVMPMSALGAMIFAWPVAPEMVAAFVGQVSTGEGLSKGSPALALRNLLMTANKKRFGDADRLSISLMSLGALRAHMENRPLQFLRPRQTTDIVDWFLQARSELLEKAAE
jgi:hypothetical protein